MKSAIAAKMSVMLFLVRDMMEYVGFAVTCEDDQDRYDCFIVYPLNSFVSALMSTMVMLRMLYTFDI